MSLPNAPKSPFNNGRLQATLLWLGVVFLLVLLVVLGNYINNENWQFDGAKAITAFGGVKFRNVLLAFAIGALGSWAFLVGVSIGLVARPQRDTILQFLVGQYLLQALFVMFGGIIAAVFQLGQVNSFAPIQALVLGATWRC